MNGNDPKYRSRNNSMAKLAQKQIGGIQFYPDLPQLARDYLKFLSERTGVEIGCISTGPERDETILIEGSRLLQLL
jgi:adenylosuccinate synthase